MAVTLSGSGRLIQAEKSRTLLYISQKVASDSAFPFKKSDRLKITIDQDGQRLVVEKVRAR